MIISVVRIPLSESVDVLGLVPAFKAAAPKYSRAVGLFAKFYTLNATETGGVFFWSDKASAEAWFRDPWWIALIEGRYGAAPTIEYYDTPVAFLRNSGVVLSDPKWSDIIRTTAQADPPI